MCGIGAQGAPLALLCLPHPPLRGTFPRGEGKRAAARGVWRGEALKPERFEE